VAINLKNSQVEKLLNEVATATGQSLTEAAGQAFAERLERLRGEQALAGQSRSGLMRDLIAEARRAPPRDQRPLKALTDELWGDE
jgi:hypothetical protein